jgi:hypothetical protein
MKAPSLKQLQIDKTSQKMIIFASIASFLLIFTLFSAKTLVARMNYQNKVINAKSIARNNLIKNVASNESLLSAYQNFNNATTNLMGLQTNSASVNSGNNAKLILDALPSEYDFPALATSLQGLLSSTGVTVSGLTGSDLSTGASSGASSIPIAGTTPIPFSFNVTGNSDNVLNTMKIFEKSIRPFQFKSFTISGSNASLSLSVNAETFYLPAQNFQVKMESVQ